MAKKKNRVKGSIKSSISTPASSSVKSPSQVNSRQFRDRLTSSVSSPIQGKVTNAIQWNRWSP